MGTLIVGAAVILAAGAAGYSLYKSRKKGGCGCGCSGCGKTPDKNCCGH